MKQIFKLQRIDIWGQRYPQRRSNITTMGYFSSKETALSAMHNFVSDKDNYSPDDKYPTWLGFIVTQYAVDVVAQRYLEPMYQCTYRDDGLFNDENLTGRDGVFRGRPADRLRFRKGDIVEVSQGDVVTLGIVYGVPMSPERCAKLATPDERGRCIEFDRGDDQYTVLFLSREDKDYDTIPQTYCPVHDHIQSQFVFTPTKPVSKFFKDRLLRLIVD